jgi:hypothetical protein
MIADGGQCGAGAPTRHSSPIDPERNMERILKDMQSGGEFWW